MLVLSRKPYERIVIRPPGGDEIVIDVLDATPGRVRLGFTAPRETQIWRAELLPRIAEEASDHGD